MGAQPYVEGISELVEEEDSDTATESKRTPSIALSRSTSSSGVKTRSVAMAECEESFASQPSMFERPKKCKVLYSCTIVSLDWKGM